MTEAEVEQMMELIRERALVLRPKLQSFLHEELKDLPFKIALLVMQCLFSSGIEATNELLELYREHNHG